MFSWFAGKTALQVGKSLAPFIAVGLVAFAIFLLWNANQKLNEELGQLRAELALAHDVNASNQLELTKALLANSECMELFELTEERNAVIVAKLKADYAKLEAQKDKVRVEREEIFRDPSCEELGNLNFVTVCPALADSVREQSRSLN